MIGFEQKYEVQKGRTVTCLQGVVHEGGILTKASFSGDDNKAKQKLIDAVVAAGAMKPIPLTEEEEKALEAAKLAKEKAEAKKDAKTDAILDADFDEMNKQPMIDFAEEWGIVLQAEKADDIRAELKDLQESLTAPE